MALRSDGDAAAAAKKKKKKTKVAKTVFIIVTDVQAGSSEDLLTLVCGSG